MGSEVFSTCARRSSLNIMHEGCFASRRLSFLSYVHMDVPWVFDAHKIVGVCAILCPSRVIDASTSLIFTLRVQICKLYTRMFIPVAIHS